jgi:uncharacterized protein
MKHPVMHFEIIGHDAPALRTFYGDVFGWQLGTPNAGDPMEYSLVDPVPGAERGIRGGIGKAPDGYDGHVTFYVVVDDIDATFAKIEARGGSRMMGPDKVPNGPIIGLFRDPEGRTIGLVDPGEQATNEPADAMELLPFIYFYGRCEEALEFYKEALGGAYEVVMRTSQNGDHRVDPSFVGKISYATFTAPGISFAASDGRAPRRIDPDEGNISLSLTVPTAAKGEQVFRALSVGGNVMTPFADAPWHGGKFGALHDRFGNEWYIVSAP